MGVTRKGRVKFAGKLGVTVTKFRGFAKPLAIVMIDQDQTTAGFGKAVAFLKQTAAKVCPIFGISEIISEERPSWVKPMLGSNEALIRPYGRLRLFAAAEITADRITDDLTDADVFGLRHLP
jgi:hypothetical protein